MQPLVLAQEHQIVGNDVAHVQVDNPVHQVEADKANGEHYTGVLVNIGWGDSQ